MAYELPKRRKWRSVNALRIRELLAKRGTLTAYEIEAELGLRPDVTHYHLRVGLQVGDLEIAEYKPHPLWARTLVPAYALTQKEYK